MYKDLIGSRGSRKDPLMKKDFPVILEGKTLNTVAIDLDDFEDLGTIEDEDDYDVDSDEGLEWWQK